MLDEKTRRAVRMGRARMLIMATVVAVGFAAVGGRLIDVMVLKAHETPADAAHLAAVIETPARRAAIVDRNGVLLAANLPTVDLYADARIVDDPKEAARKLVGALARLDRDRLERKLGQGRAFVYLDRDLTPREQAAVNALGVPGVDFRDSERRVAVQGPLFAHVLGVVDTDGNGLEGLELFFDDRLKSSPEPLRLSLDSRVQFAVRKTLLNAMERFRAIGAVGVVMEVKTGEILSMVSLPDFEPQAFGSAPADARFNRATLGVYEMGSIFKIFNTALALESGEIGVERTYDTVNPLKVARFVIHDAHRETRWLNVAEILIQSSNIGSARIAAEMGAQAQRNFLRSLGLLDSAPLELPETGAPLVPEHWRTVNTMTIAFGHGIAVTPVHVARAVAAMVNGGLLLKPTLIKGARAPRIRVISQKTSKMIRALMRLTVTEGTASKADVTGYHVGGKTGTAEKVSASGGYDKKRLRNTFAAVFPADDPRYVVIVMLDEPKAAKGTYGFYGAGWNAAPTAGEMIRKIGPILGVRPRFKPSELELRATALTTGEER